MSKDGLIVITLIRRVVDWVGRIAIWLSQPRHAWVAFVSFPIIIGGAYLWFPDWESRLRISGLLFQALGLGTVAIGLRETRKLFNQPSLYAEATSWVKNFPPFKKTRRVVVGAGISRAEAAKVSATGTSSLSPDASIEERVRFLEEQMRSINNKIHTAEKQIAANRQKQEKVLEEEKRERLQGEETTRELVEEASAGGLHVELVGLFWLFIGIVLSTASHEIAGVLQLCWEFRPTNW